MKSKHTPGPWAVDIDGIVVGPPVLPAVFGDPIPIGSAWVTGAYYAEDQTEESRANARLMAAAPELLDALREAMQAVEAFHGPDHWDVYRDHSPEMKRWRDVITKATGVPA
ncbi:hypothetical protein [Hydrogenophaga intermedia]|uniref:hypothetical protein n=1 Tax=Hydrogenophaga intermedia TaxID=65786 RepID=UPI0020435A43|nr:hypothetical protein [Hydrogenophaga intermedia]MCM3565942.1 hypothetical protein [Hydrogenophaga intermedia]